SPGFSLHPAFGDAPQEYGIADEIAFREPSRFLQQPVRPFHLNLAHPVRRALHAPRMQVEQRADRARYRAVLRGDMLVDEEFLARDARRDEQYVGVEFLQLRQNAVEIGGLEEAVGNDAIFMVRYLLPEKLCGVGSDARTAAEKCDLQ